MSTNNQPALLTPINKVTETTTSEAISIQGAKKATWVFIREDHTAGSTEFTVEVSMVGGASWAHYNKLISNTANTNVQQLTRVSSVTLNSTGVTTVSMDLEHDTFIYARVTATETTDGTHTAQLLLEY